jgi:hypothetical protein
MGKIRVIVQSSEDGADERVLFTDEFDAPIKKFMVPGLTLDIDKIIKMEIPSGFPLYYMLQRE